MAFGYSKRQKTNSTKSSDVTYAVEESIRTHTHTLLTQPSGFLTEN